MTKADLSGFVGKHIAVTGAAGALGSRLCERFSQVPCRMTRISRPSGRRPSPIPPAAVAECRDAVFDISDPGEWKRRLVDVDAVFHFAAQTSVPVAKADPIADLRANVFPMLALLEVCRATGASPVLLFSGTVTDVGLTAATPVGKDNPDRPVTVYDIQKLMAEKYLSCYAAEGTARGASLRIPNLYGPVPVGGAPDRGVLNRMIVQALAGEPLTVYGEGSQLRDYLYVDDAVDAFLTAAAAIDRVNGDAFVLGTGTGHTLSEAIRTVAERVTALTGRPVDVRHVPPPIGVVSAIDERDFVADISRFRAATGWSPDVPLTEGIDRTIADCTSRGLGSTKGESQWTR